VKDSAIALKSKAEGKRAQSDEHKVVVCEEADAQVRQLKIQKLELRQVGIRAGFKSAEATHADQCIARFFYANGLNFTAADTSTEGFYREMVVAIQRSGVGYTPPNACALAGHLMQSAHSKMEEDIEKRDTQSELSRKFGVTYSSDGWDSCDNLPLINSCYMLANDGGVYQRSVDTSGHTKNAEYCAALMIADIYSIGCTKVVHVCTDTCAVMRKCWKIVEDEFPWISCSPCQTHCPSLLQGDICKLPVPAQVIKEETLVVGWFTNHHKPLAILREKVKAVLGRSCELKRAGATRMGTNTWVGERLLELKGCLQQTVVDTQYVAGNYKDLPAEVQYTSGETVAREHRGGTAKKHVLDDDRNGFWERVDEHVKCTMPVCKFLRRHDSSSPAVGKVYHGWYEMGEHLAASGAPYAAEAQQKHEARWVYSHAAMFAAGYVVDPEFIDHDQTSSEEVMEGFFVTLEKIAILLKVRQLQEEDGRFTTSWAARDAAIAADPNAQKSLQNYPTYPDSSDADVKQFCSSVNAQLAIYKGKKGMFGREWVMESAQDMPAYLWWDQNGGSAPELQAFARMVLAQPASASICERINSEFEFVKDRRYTRSFPILHAPCPMSQHASMHHHHQHHHHPPPAEASGGASPPSYRLKLNHHGHRHPPHPSPPPTPDCLVVGAIA
jgi:hypothetical protein